MKMMIESIWKKKMLRIYSKAVLWFPMKQLLMVQIARNILIKKMMIDCSWMKLKKPFMVNFSNNKNKKNNNKLLKIFWILLLSLNLLRFQFKSNRFKISMQLLLWKSKRNSSLSLNRLKIEWRELKQRSSKRDSKSMSPFSKNAAMQWDPCGMAWWRKWDWSEAFRPWLTLKISSSSHRNTPLDVLIWWIFWLNRRSWFKIEMLKLEMKTISREKSMKSKQLWRKSSN